MLSIDWTRPFIGVFERPGGRPLREAASALSAGPARREAR